MFLGGIGPGILLVILTALWGIRRQPKEAASGITFKWSEALAAGLFHRHNPERRGRILVFREADDWD